MHIASIWITADHQIQGVTITVVCVQFMAVPLTNQTLHAWLGSSANCPRLESLPSSECGALSTEQSEPQAGVVQFGLIVLSRSLPDMS